MAKLFFDTNYFINLHSKRAPIPITLEELENHDLFVSVLTYHIFTYSYKIKIPNKELSDSLDTFYLVDLNEKILVKALIGPTSDLEDNIQLHSAAESECDIFLTQDRKLLDIKFFGKTRITSSI
ncbi:type II toxin-antitoxin system VapC family toxin [Candidatus Gottesmanbacteria bacterium]|nr:type II toxin-antitoxin system VapC family toxin [Candidatus Gottesmanbacteria bacterium]